MADVATASEIQIILRTTKDYDYINTMIPIVQDTIDRYFNTNFGGVYPVSLKRPTAILIQQMLENPVAALEQQIGDDRTRYGAIDLDVIFSGLDDLVVKKVHGGQVFNLIDINTNLGI